MKTQDLFADYPDLVNVKQFQIFLLYLQYV